MTADTFYVRSSHFCQTKPTITLQGNGLPGSAIPSPTMEKGVSAAEVEEGDSQISSISNVDFDPDDTMQSQQTAATELTQQSQTRSSQVCERFGRQMISLWLTRC